MQTNVFLEEAKQTLAFHAEKSPSCTVYATEIIAGSCLDFLVCEGEDFKNRIEWYASRREGYLVREPLDKKQLLKLETKYRLVEDSFTDKQWGQGYSVTVYGDGMYGLGPGILSMVVDEGWDFKPTAGTQNPWPTIRMPYVRLKNNMDDACIPGQPLLWYGTPGTVPLESLLSAPSKLNVETLRYGVALRICQNEARDLGYIEIPNGNWRLSKND